MIPTRRLLGRLLLMFIFLTAASPLEPQKYWVFFRDKGNATLAKGGAAWREAENRLSPRALARRAKVMPPGKLITEEDLPINAEYRTALENRGFEIIHESRWLNGVSVLTTEEEATALRGLPFVKEVRRVAPLHLPPKPTADVIDLTPPLFKTAAHRMDYGASLAQNEQIKSTILHDAGISGNGVLVGMLDSGFRWQDHEAFQHLKNKVIAERDFVDKDGVTRNEPGDPAGQDSHGTQTLSTLGGFKSGQMIGPAYSANFVFAKTEYIPTETHAEEDNWAAAIEWMDSLGVDVASSSLGYGKFDAGQGSYTPEDMDGNTTIVTKAAEIAVSKGIVVVNSAGNQEDWDIITGPADGEHVIAVGGVDASGAYWSSSSQGPTADGRIKPDVVARSVDVRNVSATTVSGYNSTSDGTSFSCPLVAGVAAQILSAHPELTPAQVMDALRNTASRAGVPDYSYGYGIVNAKAAITYWGPAFSNFPEATTSSGGLQITMRILSKAGLQSNQTKLYYAVGASNSFTQVAMAQTDSISYTGVVPQAAATDTIKLYFAARESNASVDVLYPKTAPVGYFRVLGNGTVVGVDPPQLPVDFAVLASFPNPARAGDIARIRFQLAETREVSIKVFNVLGQEVATIAANRLFESGRSNDLVWNGRDDNGKIVPGGVYFCQLRAGSQRVIRKILLLR